MTFAVSLPLRLSRNLQEAERDFPGSRPSIWGSVALEMRLEVEEWLADNNRVSHLVEFHTPDPVELHRRIIVRLNDRGTAILLKLTLG